jgi:O-antigen/teichoic acid export membrane protein
MKHLIKANIVMVVGAFFASIGAYLYHLLMGRMMSTSQYGELQSLISLSNILTIPLVAVNTTMVTVVSKLKGKNEEGKIFYLHRRLSRMFFLLLVIGGGIFFIFKRPIFQLLHIDSLPNFILLDIAIFFGLLQMLNRSMLQGLAKFSHFVVAHIIESYGKLLFGIISVYIGLQTPGAFGAFIIAGAVTYIYTEHILQRLFRQKKQELTKVPLRSLIKNSFESFFMTVNMIALFNVDVVLVRYFLPPEQSGMYAALSVLGKIIYFGTAPVANTMLPLISEAHAQGKAYHRTFLTSLLLIFALSGCIVLGYSLFPEFIIKLLIGVKYIEASKYLMLFSIFISLCSLINLLTFLFFSIHAMVPIYVMILAPIAQFIGIVFYHRNIGDIIGVSIVVTASLFVFFLIYYVYVASHQASFRYRTSVSSGKDDSP